MKTRVVYRKFKDEEVIALLGLISDPESVNPGEVLSYMHVGQHGGASPGIVDITEPTNIHGDPACLALHQELLSRGYDLEIRQKLRWHR